MAPHQQRVVDEKNDLNEKLGKLSSFISGSEIYKKLPYDEQCRLKAQLFAMQMYFNILDDRIDNFPIE